jgi:hypothetical protein
MPRNSGKTKEGALYALRFTLYALCLGLTEAADESYSPAAMGFFASAGRAATAGR